LAFLLAAVFIQGCGGSSGSTSGTSIKERGGVLLTLKAMEDSSSAMNDADDAIATLFNQDPYSDEGLAAIQAATDAWEKASRSTWAFLPDDEQQNHDLRPPATP
jgi:hypothetical protein